jgi:hypothetical protein
MKKGSMTNKTEVLKFMTHSKTASLLLTISAVALLALQPAGAQTVTPTGSIVTVSDTASATLLGPYFEVDLSNPTGMNTIFSINNTGAVTYTTFGSPPQTFTQQNGPTAVLAHVVIWSDYGVPVLSFNVYLTGFDVQRIDMRQVLTGTLPRTASAGQDPTDQISPKGRDSQDINFASCNGQLPPAALSASTIAGIQASLTGNASAANAGKCAGAVHNDNIARGYITVDTVNSCTSLFPGDVGYISSTITFQTQLTGEVFYVDQLHAIARGDNMVNIHASFTDPLVGTAGNYTFYGRYDSWDASDHRQPLPNSFAARFLNGNYTNSSPQSVSTAWGGGTVPAGSTSLVVWRDSKTAEQYFTCGTTPNPFPLGQEGVTAFDEQEHPQTIGPGFSGTAFNFGAPFPLATQVVKIGGAALPVSFPAGWVFLDLSTTVIGNPNPTSDPAAAQGWVQVIEQNFNGFFSTMHRAQATDSGTKAAHYFPQ